MTNMLAALTLVSIKTLPRARWFIPAGLLVLALAAPGIAHACGLAGGGCGG